MVLAFTCMRRSVVVASGVCGGEEPPTACAKTTTVATIIIRLMSISSFLSNDFTFIERSVF
jgi:hypothetical protein